MFNNQRSFNNPLMFNNLHFYNNLLFNNPPQPLCNNPPLSYNNQLTNTFNNPWFNLKWQSNLLLKLCKLQFILLKSLNRLFNNRMFKFQMFKEKLWKVSQELSTFLTKRLQLNMKLFRKLIMFPEKRKWPIITLLNIKLSTSLKSTKINTLNISLKRDFKKE